MTAPTNQQPPDPRVQQILAEIQAQEQARLDQTRARLRDDIVPWLKKQGVARVHAEYSGYGDSGAIDFITYLDANDQPVKMATQRDTHPATTTTTTTVTLPDIEHVLYELLPDGFAESEGGQGSITIDANSGTVKIEHQENVTETRDSLMEYTL